MEFLGYGVSEAHNLLVQKNVYGDVGISKLECVGHVQKRQGSRLRSLTKCKGTTWLSDGKDTGGEGPLTDRRIDNLQVYYGRAIRQNTYEVDCMQNAVMASLKINGWRNWPWSMSSWWGIFVLLPKRHFKRKGRYVHESPFPEAVADAIYPTLEALSEKNFLSWCLHGSTQNQNEAINAVIWQWATKEMHASTLTVELATFLAVGHLGDGSQTLLTTIDVSS